MRYRQPFWAKLLVMLALLGSASGAEAALCNSTAAGGNWTLAASWAAPCNVAGGPTAADDVTIVNGATVTVNAPGLAANSVTIATGNANTTLTFSAATSSLAVTNNVVIAAPTAAVSKQITVLTGTLTVGTTVTATAGTTNGSFSRLTATSGSITIGGDVTLTGGGSGTRDALLTASTGSITINGGLTINATFTNSSTASLTGAGSITVNGAAGVTNGGNVIVGPGTFNVTHAAATFTNSNAAIVASTTVSSGLLNVAAALTNGAAETITISNVAGRVTVGGTLTNGGTVTTGPGTVTAATFTNNNVVTVSTGLIDVSGAYTNTAAGDTVTITGAGGRLTVGGTLTNGGSIIFNTAAGGIVNANGVFSSSGIVTNTTAGLLNIGGNATFNGTFTAGAGTVTFNGTAPQTSGGTAQTFNHLTVANTGAGTTTLLANASVAGNFSINAGAAFANGANALNVAGNFAQDGTFTAGAGTVTLNGLAAVQTLSGTGPLGFANLTVNNTGGITLARDVTVTSAIIGAVTLTNTCPTDYTLTSNGGATVAHSCPPVVSSINRANPSPTGAVSVSWTVIFNKSMTGVSGSNFALVNVGLGGTPAITAVSGSGTTWTVTASTGSGSGTLGLDMTNDAGVSPALTNLPFTGQVYSVRQAATTIYYHDTTNGVAIGFDGPTNVMPGVDQVIPPIITATLITTNTCASNARSISHPPGLYTHSRWYLTTDYGVDTDIGANPGGSATLRGAGAGVETVTAGLYDYDPVTGAKVLIGSSPVITISGATTAYPYTISSPLYTVPAGRRLMLEFQFNQPAGTERARVYCPSSLTVTETPVAVQAEYRMDEGSWNGTANEVADSSGNALHGSALLGATPAAAKICNGANLAANYIEVPDNALLDITEALTVTAWLKPARWGGAPGKDALMTFLSKDTNYEAHLNATGNVFWWWGTGSFASTATVPVGAWTHVALVYASGSQTIYINGVASGTAAVAGALPVNAMPFQIGDDQAFGGGTRRFDGMIDEVKIFKSALPASVISAGYANENAGNNWDGTARVCPVYAPDHLLIEHDGGAISCAAEAVVVKACANASCSSLYTSGVSGNLTAGGNSVAFSIAAGQSQTTVNIHLPSNSAVVDPQTVRLGTASVSPAPLDAGSPYCSNSGGPINNTTSCDVSVYKAGFLFDVPHLTSATASGTVNVSAVRSSDSTTCVPLFQNVTRTVAFWGEYQNPASGTLPLQVNGGNIETTATPAYTSTYSLAFGATGVATLTSVRYDDAGLMQLNARYVGSTGNTPPDGGMIVTGADTFVVKPDHFDLSAIQQTAAPNLANPAAADATGAKFVKAGEQFSVTVTAKNALGATTANYGQESTAESVKLTSALVAGLGLTGNPTVGGTFGAFTNGVATGTAFTWNEAGIITLTPSVNDGDYLGAGDATGTTSGNVGRFYAAKFALTTSPIANRTGLGGACAAPAGCGTFTYMGEEMSAVFTLTAKAADGTTTLQNYNWSATPANRFAKLDPTAAGNPLVLAAVDTGVPRTVATLDTTTYGVASGSFASGIASVVAPFAVTRGGSASGPFDALDVGIAPADSDGAALATLDLAVNAGGTPNTHGRVGGTKARYGRMKLSNAHGSELLRLPIGVAAQYWNGTTYVTNALDNHSSFPATLGVTGVSDSNYLVNLASGETSVVTPPASVAFTAGIAVYRLAAPGAGNNGSVDMTVSALSAWLPANTARATFGVYKGNNEFIYLREAY